MRHFTYRTVDELREAAGALGLKHFELEADPVRVRQILSRPVPVATVTLGNSIAVHPMEGCDGDPNGSPGELTWRRYERFARGGAKLIWLEATAVCPEGRANPRQLWIHSGNVGEFARLLEMIRRVHRETFGAAGDLLEPLQLTHSGRYCVPRRLIAWHHPAVDQKTGTPSDAPVISDGELERLEDVFVEAARLAAEAGFRAVDIKAAHGYLLSELLGAKLRPGRYGGSLENRTRFVRNVAGKIRAAVGRDLVLAMRLGCYEGLPYGLDPETGLGVPLPHTIPYEYGFGVNPHAPLQEDLTEVRQALAWFREWGLELVNVTLGCPYFNPHVGRPFEKPDEGNYEQPEHPLLGVERHFRVAAALQTAFPDLPMVGTGYSWLQHYAPYAAAANIAAGRVRFWGVGRLALAYPDAPRDALEKGVLDPRRVCKTLTFCTYLMRQKHHPLGQFPTGCPPFDKEVYGPIIREARQTKPSPR